MRNHDVIGKQDERDRLAREIAEFEAKGGTIERLPMYAGKPAADDDADEESPPAGEVA